MASVLSYLDCLNMPKLYSPRKAGLLSQTLHAHCVQHLKVPLQLQVPQYQRDPNRSKENRTRQNGNTRSKASHFSVLSRAHPNKVSLQFCGHGPGPKSCSVLRTFLQMHISCDAMHHIISTSLPQASLFLVLPRICLCSTGPAPIRFAQLPISFTAAQCSSFLCMSIFQIF